LALPTQRKFLDNGQLVAPCSIARTGIMYYKAGECGNLFHDRDPESIVKVMTRESELFAKDSLDSYFSSPITIGHPSQDVNVSNAKELRKGHLDGVPFADGQQLMGTIVIDDAEAIGLVSEGTVELSSGHTCDVVMADGDVDWDCEKINIRANHIAIVQKGRAGSARIADEELKVDLEEMKVKLADAETASVAMKVEVTDAKTANDSLQAKLDDAALKLEEATAKILDAAAIDTLVVERMGFVSEVATLSDVDVTGMTKLEAKRAVVAKILDRDMANEGDAYVEVRYDILLEDAVAGAAPAGKSAMAEELEKAASMKAADAVKSPAVIARDKMIARNSGK